MAKSTFLRNAVLNKALRNTDFTVTNAWLALHDGFPGLTGANEVTGGSYARQQCAFDAPAAGQTQNTDLESFTGMPAVGGDGIIAFSLWDASTVGNNLYADFLGNHAWKAFAHETIADDDLICPGHGYANDDRVVLLDDGVGTLPTGVNETTLYHVVTATTDTFKVSLTQGGAAVNLTAVGQGIVRKVEPKVIGAGDKVEFAIGAVVIDEF